MAQRFALAGRLSHDPAPLPCKPPDSRTDAVGDRCRAPVGMFQVFQLGLQGLSLPTSIDALPYLGGNAWSCMATNPSTTFPGIKACSGAELVERLREQMAPFAPTLHLAQQVQTLVQQDDGRWLLGTDQGTALLAKAVVIAAGVGAFVPKTVKLEGIEALVGHSVHYHPADLGPLALQGQHVLVHGGDELAVQAALDAVHHQAASVTSMHRRDVFTAPEALLAQLRMHQDAGHIRVLAAQPQALQAEGIP